MTTSPNRTILALLTAAVILLVTSVASAQGWEVVKKEKGVTVWQKDIEGRDMPVFRGQTVIDANIYELLAILGDFDNHCKWMHGCHTAKLLKAHDAFHRISYNRTDAPWPISDRDVVLESFVETRPDTHTVLIKFRSITSRLKGEVEDVVRMKRLEGYYMLTALSEGRTKVQYQVDTDPGGSLPTWVVALASEDLPVNTLTNLKARVKKTKGQYKAFVAEWDPAQNAKAPVIIPATGKAKAPN